MPVIGCAFVMLFCSERLRHVADDELDGCEEELELELEELTGRSATEMSFTRAQKFASTTALR